MSVAELEATLDESVVFMANGIKAEATKPAQDALLNWIYQQE
jgi:hypothetical protein